VSELAGRLLVAGRLVPGRVRFDAGRITAVETDEAGAPAEARSGLPIVAPGLVDLHVHGFGGCEPLESLAGMARALAREGTTAFLPTLFPDAPERLGRHARDVWRSAQALRDGQETGEARIPGLHLEGPFVNPRAAGALPREALVEPAPGALAAILGPASGDAHGIRTMTLAPELAGAGDLVEELVRSGVRVSLGHSLASAGEARRAARAGATAATHLFNAMAPLHHREAGLAGFALSEDALVAELIGDLVHVGPEAIRLALRARGPGGLALVSDALPGAGTGCEVFHWGGRSCFARDGAFWIADPQDPGGPPRLTGAAASQLEAVRRLVRAGVLGLEEALTLATETPARALGLEDELGRLVPGAHADLIVLDADLALREVRVGGRPVPAGGTGIERTRR